MREPSGDWTQPGRAGDVRTCVRGRSRSKKCAVHQELRFRGWGGAREGAGRKPRNGRAGVPHRRRQPLAARFPVHVTVRLENGLPSLRREPSHRIWTHCCRSASERFGFRVVHYSLQTNHVHLIVEAKGGEALSRGMKGLLVRSARRLNRHWGRKGPVFADRYHQRILKTPREVRNALAYVLCNGRRHGLRLAGIDPFSSGSSFDGWCTGSRHEEQRSSLPAAHTWLLDVGWRRHGRIDPEAVPRPEGSAGRRGRRRKA
jgi:REP-associated tyrosine transposase